MILTSDELIRMLREILAGQPVSTMEPPEVAAIRERMTWEVQEIRAKGGVIDIPAEIPAADNNET